jgi:hypothetical protein
MPGNFASRDAEMFPPVKRPAPNWINAIPLVLDSCRHSHAASVASVREMAAIR